MPLALHQRVEPTLAAGVGFFGAGNSAYEAASRTSSELGGFRPRRLSADAALLPERDLMVDRQRDAMRNNGIASGYARTRLDAVVGAGLKVLPRPDYVALGQTAEWADAWQRQVKSLWRQYAEDPDCWIDWGRRCNFAQLLKQLYTSFIFNAEMIVVLEWRSRKRGAFARTAVNVIHPDLLCNPDGAPDTDTLRAGVELDPETREPIAYWFRESHPSEDGTLGTLMPTWKRVSRYVETPTGRNWGRPQVLHVYEVEQPGQTRGRPTFAAALLNLKCLEKFERTSLQTQIVQAMYAAVIESTAPSADLMGALGGRPGEGASPFASYAGAQDAYWEAHGGIRVGDSVAPHLLPNEKFEFKTPGNVAPTLDAFRTASLQNLARALPGVSYEQISGDYSKSNYSSARAADIAPWRFILGERDNVVKPLVIGVYGAVLEELIDDGRVPVPANAPSFYDAKTAWCGLRLIGAPKGHIDELKAQQSNELKRAMGVLTHEDHCAEEGDDGDDVIDRFALEKVKFKAAGLDNLLPGADIASKEKIAQQQADEKAQAQKDKAADARPKAELPAMHFSIAAPAVSVQPPDVRVEAPQMHVTVNKSGSLQFQTDDEGNVTGATME